jgi:hypothetical protein
MFEDETMRLKTAANTILAVLLFVTAGCATLETAGHKYVMRGQILEVTDGMAYLCIGSADGAQVGQEYAVYKYIKSPNSNPKSVQPYYKREKSGTVKILEILNEHMAKAKVLAGHAETNNVVELK